MKKSSNNSYLQFQNKLTRYLWPVFLLVAIVTMVANAQAGRKWQTALVAVFLAAVSLNIGAQLGVDWLNANKKKETK